MNRKDYEILCRQLKHAHLHADVKRPEVDKIARLLGAAFETNFANFDKDKFLAMCGVGSVGGVTS